jgi:hypothetical protein
MPAQPLRGYPGDTVVLVDPVFRVPRLPVGPWWRTRGMQLGHFRGQVHRGQDLLGDVLVLDERDEA